MGEQGCRGSHVPARAWCWWAAAAASWQWGLGVGCWCRVRWHTRARAAVVTMACFDQHLAEVSAHVNQDHSVVCFPHSVAICA